MRWFKIKLNQILYFLLIFVWWTIFNITVILSLLLLIFHLQQSFMFQLFHHFFICFNHINLNFVLLFVLFIIWLCVSFEPFTHSSSPQNVLVLFITFKFNILLNSHQKLVLLTFDPWNQIFQLLILLVEFLNLIIPFFPQPLNLFLHF